MIPKDKVENIVSRFNELETILANQTLKKMSLLVIQKNIQTLMI